LTIRTSYVALVLTSKQFKNFLPN